MNSKKFIRLSLCCTLVLLILVASVQIAIDPLFQYHKPWFGMEPVVTDERYQVAGMAKTFEYDIAVLGNSMSENFCLSDVNATFGGNSVKLTLSGSHAVEWAELLTILQKKSPKNVLLNISPDNLSAEPGKYEHELPQYLYDDNYLNDVSYLFNFSIMNSFTLTSIKKNKANKPSDLNTIFMWDDGTVCGRELALEHYSRTIDSNDLDNDEYIQRINRNLDLLIPYFKKMPETHFTLFIPPYSMLYWDNENYNYRIQRQKEGHLEVCKVLADYDNVSLYMWTDEEMLEIMSDLDNYRDGTHYSAKISKLLLNRIKENKGLVTKENFKSEIDKLFDYIETFNYESLFQQG